MDILKFELKSIRVSLEVLQRKVNALLVATHSRALEGGIIDFLHNKDCRLLHEKPCKFRPGSNIYLAALIYLDGTRYGSTLDSAVRQLHNHQKSHSMRCNRSMMQPSKRYTVQPAGESLHLYGG